MLAAALLLAASCAHTPLLTRTYASDAAQDERAIYSADGGLFTRERLIAIDKNERATRVVTTSNRRITAVDVDGPFLYYGTGGGFTCKPNGFGGEACIEDRTPVNELRVVTTSGGAPAVLAAGLADVLQVAHDERYIYWVEAPSPRFTGGAVRRLEKRSGVVDAFVVPLTMDGNSARVVFTDDLIIVRGFLKGYEWNDVVAFPKSGAAPYLLVRRSDSFPVADANALYVPRGIDVLRVPLAGGEAVKVAELAFGDYTLRGIAGSVLYFVAYGGDVRPRFYAYDLCTGKQKRLAIDSDPALLIDACGMQPLNDAAALAVPPQPLHVGVIAPAAAKRGELVAVQVSGVSALANVTVGGRDAAWFRNGPDELLVRIPADAPTGGVTIQIADRGACAAAFFAVVP